MVLRAVGLAVVCALAFFAFCGAQQAGGDGSAFQFAASEPAQDAWEFYVGTWLHADEFGATHTITIIEQGIYGVEAKWDKSDLLLGTTPVADRSEITFFDADGEEDRYGVVAWASPITAYGIFHNEGQTNADGNDQILLTVYRYVHQGGVESSRENITIVMLLTRRPEEP